MPVCPTENKVHAESSLLADRPVRPGTRKPTAAPLQNQVGKRPTPAAASLRRTILLEAPAVNDPPCQCIRGQPQPPVVNEPPPSRAYATRSGHTGGHRRRTPGGADRSTRFAARVGLAAADVRSPGNFPLRPRTPSPTERKCRARNSRGSNTTADVASRQRCLRRYKIRPSASRSRRSAATAGRPT